MDFDFRSFGLHPAKHFSSVQASRLHSVLSSSLPSWGISEFGSAESSEQSTMDSKWKSYHDLLLEKGPNFRKKPSKMTNYIEKKDDSDDEEHQELLAQIGQLRQSIARTKLSRGSTIEIGKPILCPLTGEPLQFLTEEEMENEGFGRHDDYEGEGDDIVLIENPFDSNSDEDNSSVFYESDGDDDARSYFPCPFCYVEIEVPVFCSHLQEEHCFDLKNAVCPLCAANLGRDATAHFIVQHSSSLKRRRKPENSNSLSGNSAMFGKKLVANGRGNRRDPTTDLLSPFICNTSIQNSDSVHQVEPSNNNVSTISDGNRASDEKDQQEKRQKAGFVQQLIASTIF